jgi:hypothetical protein
MGVRDEVQMQLEWDHRVVGKRREKKYIRIGKKEWIFLKRIS